MRTKHPQMLYVLKWEGNNSAIWNAFVRTRHIIFITVARGQTILKNPLSAELKSCGKNLLVSAQFVARNE